MNYFYIVGTCNGLVCISFSPYVYPLILCNPSTRQFREIANSEWLEEMDYDGYERVKRVTFGFGFHPSANHYKLIRNVDHFGPFEEPDIRADVCDMSTDTWTEIDADKLSAFGEVDEWGKYDIVQIRGFSASAVLNGVFYWSALVRSTNEVIVMSFDMGDEVFRKIRAPVPLDCCFDEDIWRFVYLMDEKIWRFTELKDKLALLICSDEICLDVWVLNADQNSWTNQFKVGSFPRISPYVRSGDTGEIRVVGWAKNGELVVTDHSGSGDLKLFSYDTKTLKRTDLYFGQVPY